MGQQRESLDWQRFHLPWKSRVPLLAMVHRISAGQSVRTLPDVGAAAMAALRVKADH